MLTACCRAIALRPASGRGWTAEIVERERALARGYRIRPAQDGKTVLRLCDLPELLCTDHVQQPRAARRVPVDASAEQAAVQRLRAEQASLRWQGDMCL